MHCGLPGGVRRKERTNDDESIQRYGLHYRSLSDSPRGTGLSTGT